MSETRKSIRKIARVDRLTRDQFRREYVDANRPVLVRGGVKHWPALSKWTPEYLRATAGQKTVAVRFQERGDYFRYWTEKHPQLLRMPLGEYLDRIFADAPDTRYYMIDHPLGGVSKRLEEDVDAGEYVLRPVTPRLFLGRDSHTGLHYHGHAESVMCQVVGRKHITLYPPEDWSSLYPHPWYRSPMNFSQVDVRDPDLARFPKYSSTHPLHVTMESGDMLFTPRHWWHAVASPGVSACVSYFWYAPWRRLRFPSPGISICLHALFAPVSVRAVVRRVRPRLRGAVRLRTRLRAAGDWISRCR